LSSAGAKMDEAATAEMNLRRVSILVSLFL
jgi:hypothetical protein